MRILYVTQIFTPEPTIKGVTFVQALQDAGHSVEVLTGFPNYPGGRVYPGYSVRLLQRETIDGVCVVRVPLYPSHDSRPLHRIANYASFALSATVAAVIDPRRFDAVYVYAHPPATAGLPAIALKALRGLPFVYEVQDLWPDTLPATGMFTWKTGLRFLDVWCLAMYRSANRLIVNSPGFKRVLAERGVDGNRIEVVWNWSDREQETPPALPDELEAEFPDDVMTVVFAGTMGKAQGLESVLSAARIMAARKRAVRFVFVGDGVELEKLKGLKREWDLGNVAFLPRMPFSRIGAVLQRADVLLVHLKDEPLFRITVPAKTQANMAAGRAILMAVRGEAATLVERAGAGVTCRPEDPEDMASAVERLAMMSKSQREEMGQRGRNFYLQNMSREIGIRRTDAILREVAAERRGGVAMA